MPGQARYSLQSGRSAFRGLAIVIGAVAWTAALLIGAVLAVFLTATAAVVFLMAAVLLTFASFALRARRSARPPKDPDLIEARNIGGHSWVAYGWDGRR
jgi:hypothetical protein